MRPNPVLAGPLLALALRLTLPPAAAADPAGQAAQTPAPQPASWTADVDYLLEQLEANHPDPFRYTSRETWAAEARALKARLPQLPPHLAVLEFKRLVALTGDGHTYFVPPADAWGGQRYLPVFLRRFRSGWYVRTGHRDHPELFGKRITALGGVPMDEVLRRLEPYAGSPNRMRVLDSAQSLLRLPQVLHALGVIDGLDRPVPVTAADETGREITVSLHAQPDWINDDFHDADVAVASPKPAYRSFDGNFDLVHYPEHEAMYFYFGEVRDDDDETLAAFTQRLFREIDTHQAKKLIIDLRENNGGNLYLIQPLVHELIRRNYPPGSLFVLIGRDTWSAAMALAVQIERETSAIFVGEPTPSPPNFWGDTEPIVLPASGITVECSSLWWQFSDPRDTRPWIAPDVPATETYADFMAHRDVPLEAVWAYHHQPEVLAPGSVEMYDVPTSALPAIRWQRESQSAYDDAWMW